MGPLFARKKTMSGSFFIKTNKPSVLLLCLKWNWFPDSPPRQLAQPHSSCRRAATTSSGLLQGRKQRVAVRAGLCPHRAVATEDTTPKPLLELQDKRSSAFCWHCSEISMWAQRSRWPPCGKPAWEVNQHRRRWSLEIFLIINWFINACFLILSVTRVNKSLPLP